MRVNWQDYLFSQGASVCDFVLHVSWEVSDLPALCGTDTGLRECLEGVRGHLASGARQQGSSDASRGPTQPPAALRLIEQLLLKMKFVR